MKNAVFLLIFAGIPTIFLYAAAFVILAGACSLVLGMRRGLVVGGFLMLGLAVIPPLVANRPVMSALEMEPAGDRRPTERLTIEGDVLVGSNPSGLAEATETDGLWICHEICALLLATPGIRTVTATDEDEVASFAVAPTADCAIDPREDFANRGVLVWKRSEDCLQRIPLVRQHDYSVELEGDPHLQGGPFPVPALENLPERAMVTTVRDGRGQILMQITQRRATKIVTPLSFCWTLDLHDNKGFCALEVSDLPDDRRLPHRLLLADFTNVPDTRSMDSATP